MAEIKKGGITVQTEHIFPIIKRWLYSDKDIFLREVISNSCDAITKHKRLVSLGNTEASEEEYMIEVRIDKENKTVTVSDNGIGMTEDEVSKYINQMALSGALDFISKYEGEDSSNDGIIGHFGLGFYSTFMVSTTVEIQTKSYDGSPAVHWICNEDGEYSMEDGDKQSFGTDIIMHISDDELSYLDIEKVKGILKKYCSFIPYPIYLYTDTADKEKKEKINDLEPLWQKRPADITDDQYKDFYRNVFGDYREALFWVHINADYPLNFNGILFFPKPRNDMDANENEIKLFYNSVFVADNIKEILPDYLLNFKGVFDCPELPLNVSRSYLQDSAYIKKVSSHIVKKLSDKLTSLFNNERTKYEEIWSDIKSYIQFAAMRDNKFYDKVCDALLFSTVDGKHITLKEYTESDGYKEGTVYYATSEKQQSYFIKLYSEKNIPILLLDRVIENQFISFIESKNEKLKFRRVDDEISAISESDEENEQADSIKECFKKYCGEKTEIKLNSLGEDAAPALLNISEESRRLADMYAAYGLGKDAFPVTETLIINTDNKTVKALSERDEETKKLLAEYIYYFALLSSRQLNADELKRFIEVSNLIISKI